MKMKTDKEHIKLQEKEEIMIPKIETLCTKTKGSKRAHLEVIAPKKRVFPGDENIGVFMQNQEFRREKFDSAVAHAVR